MYGKGNPIFGITASGWLYFPESGRDMRRPLTK